MVSKIPRVLKQLQGDRGSVVFRASVRPDGDGIRTLVLDDVLPQSLAQFRSFLVEFFLQLIKATLEEFQLT